MYKRQVGVGGAVALLASAHFTFTVGSTPPLHAGYQASVYAPGYGLATFTPLVCNGSVECKQYVDLNDPRDTGLSNGIDPLIPARGLGWTMGMWVKVDSLTAPTQKYHHLFSWWPTRNFGSAQGISVRARTDTLQIWVTFEKNQVYGSDNPQPDGLYKMYTAQGSSGSQFYFNVWQYVAVTIDPQNSNTQNQVNIFVNGLPAGNTALGAPLYGMWDNVRIGAAVNEPLQTGTTSNPNSPPWDYTTANLGSGAWLVTHAEASMRKAQAHDKAGGI